MRNPGLLAFGVTTCVLLPAAIHRLSAGHDQVIKFVTPDTQEIELGGAKVQVKLEHRLVDPGEAMHVKLAATGAAGKRLEVGLLVYGSSGTEGDRVPSPPVGISHQTVTIPIDALGTGSMDVAVALRGGVANRYEAVAFSHYEVLVMSPRAADKLDRLRRNSELIGGNEGIPSYNDSASHFMQLYRWGSDLKGEDAKLFAESSVAKISAYTRAINPSIAIQTPSTAPVGEAFTVTVVVQNPSKQAASGLELTLDTPTGVIEDSEKPTGISALVMPDNATFDLLPGETKRFSFRVMPDEVGVLGLYAHIGCKRSECEAPDKLTATGTFDATEIGPRVIQDQQPSVVGTK